MNACLVLSRQQIFSILKRASVVKVSYGEKSGSGGFSDSLRLGLLGVIWNKYSRLFSMLFGITPFAELPDRASNS